MRFPKAEPLFAVRRRRNTLAFSPLQRVKILLNVFDYEYNSKERKSPMNSPSNLVVCMGAGADKEEASALANRIGVPLSDEKGSELTLMTDSSGITLMGYGLSYRGDFEQMLYRLTKGRVRHEMLIHAAKTKLDRQTAVDATAGMGEDSILLAAYGYNVIMFEQNAVIAELLKDAIKRAKQNPQLADIMERMHLIEGNSIDLMPRLDVSPDLIYLDPMFPARQKSGLINKKLQLIQKLEQPCVEEEKLFNAANLAQPKKIIVKRPLKGRVLAERKPSYSIKGKAIRYDCYVL